VSQKKETISGVSSAGSTAEQTRLYVQTNAAPSNGVAIFTRTPDATPLPFGTFVPLTGFPPNFAPPSIFIPAGPFPTEGAGTGTLLPGQGALALSSDGRYLFAVDAGSNEVSSLGVTPGGLRLINKVPSGGIEPRSLTVHDDLVYAVNGFGTGTISGYRVGLNGELTPVEDSIRTLSSPDSAPVQISFNHDGTLLVVTELFADRITVFRIGNEGKPTGMTLNPSAGESPYGFAFDRHGKLIVSEAFGLRPKESAVSSYHVDKAGKLTVISASVPDFQQAACWVVTTPDGHYAYTSNTVSGSISGYRVDAAGKLTLLDPDGRTGITGDASAPADMVVTRDGRYLYVLNTFTLTVDTFRIGSDGHLSLLPGVGNLPGLPVGLAIG